MIDFQAAIFPSSCVLSDCPPALWWLITSEGAGSHYMTLLWLTVPENQRQKFQLIFS